MTIEDVVLFRQLAFMQLQREATARAEAQKIHSQMMEGKGKASSSFDCAVVSSVLFFVLLLHCCIVAFLY